MKYDVKVSKSMDEINLARWDDIADFCFLKSEVLISIEKLPLCKDSYYVEIFDNKKIIAIAVFYAQRESLYSSLEESLYGKYSKLVKPVLGLNPSLLCYFPYSPFYQMFKIKDGYDKNELFDIISDELEVLAREGKYSSYGFLAICDESLIENPSKFMVMFSGFKIEMAIGEENFEEYVQTICKKSCRKLIRKERRLFKNSDYSVEIIKKLGKSKDDILKIFEENFSKYGERLNQNKLSNEFIKTLDKNSKNLIYFIGKLNKKIISVLMVIEDENRLLGIRIGQVNSKKDGFPFFNLAIYEPLIYGMGNSKKIFELGTGAYTYKTRRGAQLRNTYNLIKSTNKIKNMYLRPIFKILDKRNKKKHAKRVNPEVKK